MAVRLSIRAKWLAFQLETNNTSTTWRSNSPAPRRVRILTFENLGENRGGIHDQRSYLFRNRTSLVVWTMYFVDFSFTRRAARLRAARSSTFLQRLYVGRPEPWRSPNLRLHPNLFHSDYA